MQIDGLPGAANVDVARLLDAIADMNDQDTLGGFFAELCGLLKRTCSITSLAAFEFRKDMQPHLIFVDGPGGGGDLTQYLGGLYLLDPFFILYDEDDATGVFVMDHKGSDTLIVAKKYKAYWNRIAGDTEVAALFPIAPGHSLHLTVMISHGLALADRTVEFVRALERTIVAYYRRTVMRGPRNDITDEEMRRNVHLTVNRTLQNFGAEVLTERERDVVQLLLKGHSAKSIAQILDISAGTAGIHRSNIYRKLDVAGQGDLFLRYITLLRQE